MISQVNQSTILLHQTEKALAKPLIKAPPNLLATQDVKYAAKLYLQKTPLPQIKAAK